MTLKEFANVFGVLAVQLRFTDADEVTIKSYFEALKDLDLELVQMAAQQLAKTPGTDGKAWFPGTPEWRAAVTRVEVQRIDEQRARIRARLRAGEPPLCSVCDDTGFARNEATNRVEPCACRKLRRLEILGRRPMPALPEKATA